MTDEIINLKIQTLLPFDEIDDQIFDIEMVVITTMAAYSISSNKISDLLFTYFNNEVNSIGYAYRIVIGQNIIVMLPCLKEYMVRGVTKDIDKVSLEGELCKIIDDYISLNLI